MRSLGDVSARPAKGLRHPEKAQKRDSFWDSSVGAVFGQFWETAQGRGKKGPKKGQKLYIYSY